MFPEEVDPQTEDCSLHAGRIRSFKHERGNWATYVYLPCELVLLMLNCPTKVSLLTCFLPTPDHPEEEFQELLEQLLSVAGRNGVALTPQEEFHLSLSQTVVLRHHWIQPFTRSLKAGLAHCKRFGLNKMVAGKRATAKTVSQRWWPHLNLNIVLFPFSGLCAQQGN